MELKKLIGFCLVAGPINAFSFGIRGLKENAMTGTRHDPKLNLTEMFESLAHPADIYTSALSELQALESKPLCHRIAARLLVGNCQLLDGKDEASIYMDSGRQIRDFVDAYAASMAICDLERGRFRIPASCEKFRESTLAHLPLDNHAHLHVSTHEIDLCISGLGQENSAWSTWISYRHRALIFCEAARADQEKAQSVLLFQRLTRIMAKLTYGVEVDIRQHMENLENLMQKAGGSINALEPNIERLRARLAKVEDLVTNSLDHAAEKSRNSISEGLQNAEHLQRMLAVMIQAAVDGTSLIAARHENSLDLARQREEDLSTVLGVLAAAAGSAQVLNSQIDASRFQVQTLSKQQKILSTDLDVLTRKTDVLASKWDEHVHDMNEAKNATTEIFATLQQAAENAATISRIDQERRSIFGHGVSTWMPYIMGPIATLLLGSYGLEPSAIRNLILVALGELIGFSCSNFHLLVAPWYSSSLSGIAGNSTIVGL